MVAETSNDAIKTCRLALTSVLAPESANECFPLEQKMRQFKLRTRSRVFHETHPQEFPERLPVGP